ncbi:MULTISPECIES: hypothetical protein [Sphingomonadaceae]|uniref:hypothetical protein n=1 Tax=Sphingomonadales TaxID=204457 RepID=UPI00077031CD|nr:MULTISPECIES: hypothetical protein [Sphingomonadaceae]AMK23214.1 hypothetical protein K426_11390 [Sphingobium sp. TKS]MCF8709105.1 hypothetical protein [Rhizorhapis sp. SPR117]
MPPTFRDRQLAAMARHAATGETWCLLAPGTSICMARETDILAGGQHLIDAIVWSTDAADEEQIDPALRA